MSGTQALGAAILAALFIGISVFMAKSVGSWWAPLVIWGSSLAITGAIMLAVLLLAGEL